ncbi:MAG: hypothetical protein ACTSWY_14135 [Promethearchaeota archaeon]
MGKNKKNLKEKRILINNNKNNNFIEVLSGTKNTLLKNLIDDLKEKLEILN